VDADDKRKRQLLLVVAVGVVLLFIVGATALFPVGASFSGDSSYNCGTPFRRWRSPSALKREWRKDTQTIEKAYPATKVNGKVPLLVCANRVATRLRIIKAAGAMSFLLIGAPLGLYWYGYGFIRDPHV
jgi:hypothetical protein